MSSAAAASAAATARTSASRTRRAARASGAPRPAPWAGELEASRPGPPAPQPEAADLGVRARRTPPGDEDCLTLNVWTPPGDGPWPVLVWAIGGGVDDRVGGLVGLRRRRAGRGGERRRRQLHATGSARSAGSAGNWGLLDHVAVLEWVRENIAAFGGDPARVTLGGQSAGAANVADLLVCPAAEGLFARAILHSPPLPEAANDPERGARWAARPVRRESRADAPAEEIVAAHEALLREGEWRGTRGAAWPTLDAATLPVSPLDAPGRAAGRPRPRRHDPRRGDVPVPRRRDRDAPDEQVVRGHRASCSPSRRGAGRASARPRAARSTCSALDHPSHDPRLGALHTIDVPLLFGTFRTSEVARHYVDDDARTRAVSDAMQARLGAVPPRRRSRDWRQFHANCVQFDTMTTFIAEQTPGHDAARRAGAVRDRGRQRARPRPAR